MTAAEKLKQFVAIHRGIALNEEARREGILLWWELYTELQVEATAHGGRASKRQHMGAARQKLEAKLKGLTYEQALLDKTQPPPAPKPAQSKPVPAQAAHISAKTGGRGNGQQHRGKRGGKKEGGQGGSGSALQQ